MTDYNNFMEVVKAGTDADNPTRVVQIANPSDLNPIQVDTLPTASADNKGLIYWLSTDNTFYKVNDAGDDYEAIGTGSGGSSDWGDIGGTLSDQTDLQAALDAKIGASGVTFENLSANSDVGTGANQVAAGNHVHPATAISFDGSTAGLDATTVQAAIDEIIVDGEGAANVWQTIYADGTGLTPDSTSRVPYTGTGIAVGMGVRATYDDGGGDDVYYGIVSAVSASTSFDTHLAIFNTSYPVTKIEVCDASALTEILLHAPGLYAGEAHDDIFTDWGTPVVAGKAFAVGRVYAKQGMDDSAATTTEPAININIGGTSNNIFSADLEMTTSFADATAAPSFTHYTAAAGEVIDVKVARATGGTPGHDAANLAVLVVGVPL